MRNNQARVENRSGSPSQIVWNGNFFQKFGAFASLSRRLAESHNEREASNKDSTMCMLPIGGLRSLPTIAFKRIGFCTILMTIPSAINLPALLYCVYRAAVSYKKTAARFIWGRLLSSEANRQLERAEETRKVQAAEADRILRLPLRSLMCNVALVSLAGTARIMLIILRVDRYSGRRVRC